MIPILNQLGPTALLAGGLMLLQTAILVAGLALVDWVWRHRLRAALRYALWSLVIFKLLLPPTLLLPTGAGFWLGRWLASPIVIRQAAPLRVSFRESATSIPLPQAVNEPLLLATPEPSLGLTGWLLLTWGSGTFGLAVWIWRRNRGIRHWMTTAELAPPEFNEPLRKAATELNLTRVPELHLSRLNHSPAVCGLIRPRIILPATLARDLQPAALRDVLLHELTHIQRRDLWFNALQTLVQIIWWWNPLVWVTNSRLRMLRERAVDERVMLLPHDDRVSYPETLLDVARHCTARPALALSFVGILESRGALRIRIEHLLNGPLPREACLGWSGWMVVAVVAFTALPMAFARRVETAPVAASDHTLPTSDAAAPESPISQAVQVLTVRFSAGSDDYVVNGEHLDLAALRSKLVQERKLKPDLVLRFRRHSGVDYTLPIAAIDAAREIGISRFDLAQFGSSRTSNNGLEPHNPGNSFDAAATTPSTNGRASKPGTTTHRIPDTSMVVSVRPAPLPTFNNLLVVNSPANPLITADQTPDRYQTMAVSKAPVSWSRPQRGSTSQVPDVSPDTATVQVSTNSNDFVVNGQHLDFAGLRTLLSRELQTKPNLRLHFETDNESGYSLETPAINLVRTNDPGVEAKLSAMFDYLRNSATRERYDTQNSPSVEPHPAPLLTRIFKVDPRTFPAAVEAVLGLPTTPDTENSRTNGAAIMLRLHDFFRAAGVDFSVPPYDPNSAPAGERKALFFKDRTGVLFVRATMVELEIVEKAIQALNVPPAQVMIDAEFLELPESEVQGPFFRMLFNDPTSAGKSANSPTDQTRTQILSEAQSKALLKGLEHLEGARVLGRPKVITLSGRAAEIQINDAIPVTNPASGATNPVPVGLSLRVLPEVLADDQGIRLNVLASLSTFLGQATEPPHTPLIGTNRVNTNLLVRDGQTLLLTSGPVGKLSPKTHPSQRHLLVFVKAAIVDPAGQAERPK